MDTIMRAMLLALWGMITSLLGQDHPYDILTCEPSTGVLHQTQRTILADMAMATMPDNAGVEIYEEATKVKTTGIMEAEFLETFPAQEYRIENLLVILLDESTTAELSKIHQAKARIKEICDFIFEKMNLYDPALLSYETSGLTEYLMKWQNLRRTILRSIFSTYSDKFLGQLNSLYNLASDRADGGKRLDLYHRLVENSSEHAEEENRQAYYNFLKRCGVSDPVALGDFPE